MRQRAITAGGASPTQERLSIFRDEPLELVISETPTPARHIMTIGRTAGGDPLVELPTTTGRIILSPISVQMLAEGGTYEFNIWSEDVAGAIALVVRGSLSITPSIVPFGVDVATTFLNNFGAAGGPSRIAVMTRAAYAAIASPAADTIYLLTE